MALKLFNTLSRQKEDFQPIKDKEVGLYTCGPTVYDYPHIGNYRAYIFGDILKRTLKYDGYNVRHIMNLTDVDDKTIKNSQAQGKSLAEFTEFFTDEFYKDRDALNIIPADLYTKATDYIPEMVKIIETLLEKGIAYKEADGSVYFNIKKFEGYGKLAHLQKESLKEGGSGRVKKDEYEKENVQDFALWKAYDETDGDVFWQTSLGKGRPGWHIECSAMSMANLGESFDIHTGGVDNIFPHHENEIAQSEGATGKPFAKYWLHNEWLLVDGKKMSKSLGNFYTLRDIEKKGFSPLAYRYLALQNHYKTPLNFTLESLQAAQNALHRLENLYLELGEEKRNVNKEYQEKFKDAMDNDLETPASLALLWDLVKNNAVTNADKKATLLNFNEVLGLGLDKLKPVEIPEEILKLKADRTQARKNKDWALSDKIRDQINERGFDIKDNDEDSVLVKLR